MNAQFLPIEGAQRPVKLAILAIGGQGGGVLADWIVGLATANGYIAQYTSVQGVAQRTGATIYYLELFPQALADAAGRDPVMALMPAAGDVDIVIAAELMEAGRAMVRGLVSADRTTLIASTHRIYGVGEKSAMGDGRGDPAKVLEAAARRARRLIAFDMAKVAEDQGSVISASLFGALAGSQALPFPREAYERTIVEGGLGVKPSLKAFAAAYDAAQGGEIAGEAAQIPAGPTSEAGRALLQRIRTGFPAASEPILWEGVKRLADYQDLAYAGDYLDRLAPIAALDRSPEARLTIETGRYLALWMSYEDVIRVADLKTRATRFSRIRGEVRAEPDQIVHLSEFMHPRFEELCDTLPAGLADALARASWVRRLTAPMFREGRRVATTRLPGFLLLSFLAALRPTRRRSRRYREETRAMTAWLTRIASAAPFDYALACEVAECQRLVKGYGDTHARGRGSFDAIMAELDAAEGGVAADRVRALRDAALADPAGAVLSRALATPASRPAWSIARRTGAGAA